MKIHTALAIGTLALLMTTDSFAGEKRINARQQHQQQRIQQGTNSGQLTEGEAQRLERGQHRVNNMETRAGADGTVNKGEARKIERAQDRQSRKIRRAKHNQRRARPGAHTEAPAATRPSH